MTRAAAALAVGFLVLALAAPAGAAGWHRVTPTGGDNTDEVGLLRSADGVLHAAWVQADAADPATQDIATRTIEPAGKPLGPVSLIAAGWSTLSNPALVGGPAGLRAFFGGIRSTLPDELNNDLNTAVSADGGASWALQIGNVSDTPGAYASSTSATLLATEAPIIAGGGSGYNPYVTTGLTPGAPVFSPQSQLVGNFGYDPNLVTDATGTPYLAWSSNAAGALGVWAQPLTSAAAAAAPPTRMPGIVGKGFSPQAQRTPIAARTGGGIYVAYPGGYPVTTRVRLWEVGTSASAVVASGPGDHEATVAADSEGRLWVVWSGEDNRIDALRTNKAATAFGATVSVAPPHGTHTVYRLDASAAMSGAVDVLALTDAGADATWQRRLLPGLSLSAKPYQLKQGKTTKVTFRVLDASVPVSGAKVSAAGHTAKTDLTGRAKLTVAVGAHAHHLTATAAHGGYTTARLRVKVVH